MAMPVKDFRQLEKLMMMTTSDVDAEALTALRMANAVLKRHGYTWSGAFRRLVKVEDPLQGYEDVSAASAPAAQPCRDETITQARARHIRHALEVAENSDPRGQRADFVASLREQFDRRGQLTDPQREALFRIRDEIEAR